MLRYSLTLLAFILSSHLLYGADEHTQFVQLTADVWEYDVEQDPLHATFVGDHRFNDKLPDASLSACLKRGAAVKEFFRRWEAIDRTQLEREEQINYDIFGWILQDRVKEFDFKNYLTPITNRWGFHISFPQLPKEMPLKTVQDYENYLARLEAFPTYTDQHIERLQLAIEAKRTLPSVVLKGYRKTIDAHIVTDATESVFYAPFEEFPAAVKLADRKALTARAKKAILEKISPSYERFLKFMTEAYLPQCRDSIGASGLPDGRAYYRHRVHKFTTLDLSPQQVHDLGLKEVKRIKAEMLEAIQAAKFEGDFEAFVEFLRTDEQFYVETPEELLRRTALILKRMDGKLPELFKTLPRTPYGLREVPAYIAPQTTTAYYSLPPGDGSKGGFYYLNTYDLKSRPTFELEALSLHEAVPGHHLQLALQQERVGLPKFRRYASFTVYVEGWALYAERLGLEAGFYQDPYSDFGRLSFEMWRACRLVVDTGIHYFGWTRRQAIEYMAANTALTRHNIEAEVDRYISWPGQALGYKVGELKIRELRKKAETELGSRFDLREFHEVVLSSGSVPLSVLEENVDRYIAREP